MEFNEKISIIVPAYNCQEYIKECIDSLINQTYKNTEIIVIDDGSTDKTTEILKTYHDKIDLIIQSNSGVSAARNTGIKAATGKYCMFVDSDDWIDQDMISQMTQYVQQNVIVRCGMVLEYPHKKEVRNIVKKNTLFTARQVQDLFIHTYDLSGPVCQLIKREDIKNLFQEDISYGEDFLFNYQNYGNNDVLLLKDNFYHYRIVENSMTNSLDLNKIMKVCEDILKVYPVLLQKHFTQDTFYRVVKEMNKGFVRVFKSDSLTIKERKNIIESFWFDQRLVSCLKNLKYKEILKNKTIDMFLILFMKLRWKQAYELCGKFLYSFVYKIISKK